MLGERLATGMNLSSYFNAAAGYFQPVTSKWNTNLGQSLLNDAQIHPTDLPTGGISGMSLFPNVTEVFNRSSDNSTDYASMEVGSQVILILLYTLTIVAAIIGNTLSIIVFAKGHRSRTDLRPFLMSLSVADLIMALFCIPFTTTFQILGEWIFSEPMCPIVLFLQTISVTASVSTNMAIGIDRFFAVTYPLRKRVTSSRSKYVIVLIWIIAIALSIVQLFVGRTFTKGSKRQCGEKWPEPSETWLKTYTLFIMFLTYFTPLFILTVTYTIVGRILWRRTVPGHSDEIRDAMQLKSKRKVVKMLVTVVVLFGLCWLPLHVFFLLQSFSPKFMTEESKESLYYACHWLSMANSFVNPVIYGFMNNNFRADAKSLVHSCCCWNHKLTYRPGARRWKVSSNVRDMPCECGENQSARGLLNLKDRKDCWHNGNLDYSTGVIILTKSC